jgi:lysophospholipase L1-like esterase
MAPSYRRFVALGDSQTEGLNDLDDTRGLRGWADRFAETLADSTSPDLTYANLAVRGCRARHVIEHQLPVALSLRPDLATVVVGMNDLLRHDYDVDHTVSCVEETFAALIASGCQVVTMTFPDIALMLPVMSWLRPREALLNQRIVEVAERHGVGVLDLFPLRLSADPMMWSHDRIHGSAYGHARIAAGMARLFDLPDTDDTWAESGAHRLSRLAHVRREAQWVATFMVPFLARQLLGRAPISSRMPKRPTLRAVQHEGHPTLAGGAAFE